ncbi:hypothetical protein DFH09DRAFT_1227718 [Mycena vulgaris]|nr:hypothetical protein DFH09DRAFT_1227718 [Mycena vulgaris]
MVKWFITIYLVHTLYHPVYSVYSMQPLNTSRTLRSMRSTRAPHPATSGASHSADRWVSHATARKWCRVCRCLVRRWRCACVNRLRSGRGN